MYLFMSSQWAEVLSADAFSAFEDAGLDNEKVRFDGHRLMILPHLILCCFHDCQTNTEKTFLHPGAYAPVF
jgi:hypothetical protein